MEHFALARILKFLPGIILGLTVHEFSHAWVARFCGDNTSQEQGRVSLNPLKHIDLLGFAMLLFAGFGWAKPVQFNEQKLRNPRADIMKIAVAGPLSNALTAIIISFIYAFFSMFAHGYGRGIWIVNDIFLYAIYLNWGLFVFNMIPIPPLDGSHLLLNYFRKFPVLHANMYKYGSYIFFAIILAMIITKIDLLPIWPVVKFLGNGFLDLFQELFN
jgi:Zn-dependent protease